MKEKQLMRFIKKIIVANKDHTSRAQKEISELAKKLRADGVSVELVKLTKDIALYLPYTDFNRKLLPFSRKYLESQIAAGKIRKQEIYGKKQGKKAETKKAREKKTAVKKEPKERPKSLEELDEMCYSHIPSSIYSRASEIMDRYPGNSEAVDWAENLIKDAERGCFH